MTNETKLYAVTVGGVCPTQCVVVWDNKDNAQRLTDHLNATVRNVCTVEEVNSFFPGHMTDADKAWLDACGAYIRGDHHNTSAN